MLATASFTITSSAQAPQGPPGQPPGGGPPHSFPAPTNLKVLPKNLTGQQVHEIMETWEGSLGVHCNTCHAADPKNIGPNGKPRLNFADDSKEQKRTARQMYKMTEGINTNYIAKVPDVDMDKKVTCGTCHRGHLDPEPYVIPKEEHGPPPAGGPAGAPPPGQN
jgi:mono/diheme cytochrome c family protein